MWACLAICLVWITFNDNYILVEGKSTGIGSSFSWLIFSPFYVCSYVLAVNNESVLFGCVWQYAKTKTMVRDICEILGKSWCKNWYWG